MKVWVVTVDDYSHEGLEGAFDVFFGVASSALGALALIDDGRERKQSVKFDLDVDTGTESYEQERGEYRNRQWVVTSTTWVARDCYHIKQIEVAE